jgi:HK97 family phage major capsid protein
MDDRELRQRHQELLDQAQAIVDTAEAEDRDLTTEERGAFDGLMAQADELRGRIERAGTLASRRAGLGDPAHRAGRPDPAVGLTAEDLRNYSLVRAIRAAANRDWSGAGFELEVSQAVAQRIGRDPSGFFVPAEWMRSRPDLRDLSVGVPTAGGYTVATDLLSSSFIELLRNRMITREAGATILGDLVGDVDIPKQTGGATVYWVGEGAAPTEGAITFGQVGLTPKTAAAYVDITRKLMKQSSLDVEAFVRSDLASGMALAIDYAGLHGSGVGSEPLGVANTAGIGSVVGGDNGAAPDWADVIELETDVAVGNADVGRLAYITNAKVRGKLKQTETASGVGIFVWNTDAAARPGVGMVNGYPALVTNQVRSDLDKGTSTGVCSAIFFGNWADLVFGLWGVLDILVDPYTLSTSGGVRVVAMQDVDVAVRHPDSFSAMLDALTA